MTQISTPTQPPNPLNILIINPNTTTAMTSALEPAITSLGYHLQNITFTYFTCPSTPSSPGIPSINSPDDALASAHASFPHLAPLVPEYDAFLVACYSEHPLVGMLREEISRRRERKYVTGIFEASVTASLTITGSKGNNGFGIVSTGKIWETALATAVHDFMGVESPKFLGCETTGLNASELHELPGEVVRVKMMEATKRLVGRGRESGKGVRAVCLGCAGMVGLEEAVRMALREELGVEGEGVAVVDGVLAGVGELVMLARGRF